MKSLPLLFALLCAVPVGCQACAVVSSDMDEEIRTTNELALIVWDAKTGTEHFIRQANFQTDAKDFGFLVPTPTKPQLASTNNALFNDLQRELLPKTKIEARRGINFTPFFVAGGDDEALEDTGINAAASTSAADEGDEADMSAVEVVEQTRVGDYNASVLRASDTAALTNWLSSHKYSVTPDTRDWLEPYVRQGFFITAFQIAANRSSQSAQVQAVRLTFKADAPFYPYREPNRAQQQTEPRSLELFLVGDTRVEGHIENADKKSPWPSQVKYSAPLDAKNLQTSDILLPSEPLHLTAFVDDSAPRPGWGDLKFAPASDQTEITPSPNIIHEDRRVSIPIHLLIIFIIGAAMWWNWKRDRTFTPNT
ncbi:DUF2330 domain-containing protein [bacterium]|nr:MAG: DUF2330 domain-containing protein [bacterium]